MSTNRFGKILISLLLIVSIVAGFLSCNKKNDTEDNKVKDVGTKVYVNNEIGDVILRREFSEEELARRIVEKSNGSSIDKNGVTTECGGDVYMTSYELTNCAGPNRQMNFYVRVLSELTPSAVRVKVRQRMSGTTFREIILSNPVAYYNIEPDLFEFKFVLNLNSFNICTEGTTEVFFISSATSRCRFPGGLVDVSSTQQMNETSYNCRTSYAHQVTVSGNTANFSILTLACASYGWCTYNPSNYSYEYRIKNSGANWTTVTTNTLPFSVSVAGLASGTYESRGRTICLDSDFAQYSPLVNFVIP